MRNPTVDEFMTRSPQTIGREQSLASALRLMSEQGIRHLPVLDGGKLVGVVSERDLQFLQTFEDIDLNRQTVSDAIATEPFSIDVGTPVRKVAAEMADHKYGSSVVLEHGRVVGIFTTTDAVRALFVLLDSGRQGAGQ